MGRGVTTFTHTAGSGMNYTLEDVNKIRGKPESERTDEEKDFLRSVEEMERK